MIHFCESAEGKTCRFDGACYGMICIAPRICEKKETRLTKKDRATIARIASLHNPDSLIVKTGIAIPLYPWQFSEADKRRFWSKVDKRGGPKACWPWTAGCDRDGYGKFWVGGKTVRAHRAAIVITTGKKFEADHGMHSCDTPSCCNPRHVVGATCAENQTDKTVKSRQARGSSHGNSRITEGTARKIKALARQGVGLGKIARQCGVTSNHAYLVIRGWKHLDGEKA